MTALLRWEPDPAPRTFGERLAWVRRRLGLSVREVAERTGFAESTIPTWEKGAMPRDPVRVATVYQRTLRADRDWLLYGDADDDGLEAEYAPRDSNPEPADFGVAA